MDLTPETQKRLSDLVGDLEWTKAREEEKRKDRIVIEEEIAALIPGPERGQVTITLEDGRKVTVERGFNYKADCSAIEAIFNQDILFAPVKTKTTRELDITGYEWYRDNDRAGFELLSQHVTVTPKKTAISVKVPKE